MEKSTCELDWGSTFSHVLAWLCLLSFEIVCLHLYRPSGNSFVIVGMLPAAQVLVISCWQLSGVEVESKTVQKSYIAGCWTPLKVRL